MGIYVILWQRRFGSNWDLVNNQVPFAFPHRLMKYAIIGLRLFGSNRDLVNNQVPFAFQDSFYPQVASLRNFVIW